MNATEFLATPNPRFKDFVALKVGGKDEYSALRYAALKSRMTELAITQTEAARSKLREELEELNRQLQHQVEVKTAALATVQARLARRDRLVAMGEHDFRMKSGKVKADHPECAKSIAEVKCPLRAKSLTRLVAWVARRAVKRIGPSLLLFLETEIWPNLVREAYRRGIPTIMLSGRLSDKALSRYELARPFFRHVLAQYTALGMQSGEDAARMLKLGAPEKKVSVVGNLKFAVDGVVSGRENVVRSTVTDRQVLVAGSTHRGEELALLRALQLARAGIPKLMMVLAPRHPERFSEVEKLLRESSFSFERKTTLQPDQYFRKDVLLLDTVGELTEFFNAADLAFVGGSLVDAGGHNILEPARCRKPVLFGPYMENFRTIAEGMKRSGGAIEVHGAEDLAHVLTKLLADPEARHRIGQSAADFAAQFRTLAVFGRIGHGCRDQLAEKIGKPPRHSSDSFVAASVSYSRTLLFRIQQHPEIRQHFVSKATGPSHHTITMVAVVFLEHVIHTVLC